MVDNSSIGQLYAGPSCGVSPVGLYIIYVTIRCYINPKMGPPVPKEERLDWKGLLKVLFRSSRGHPDLPGPGTIVIGIAAPTEAAGVGVSAPGSSA